MTDQAGVGDLGLRPGRDRRRLRQRRVPRPVTSTTSAPTCSIATTGDGTFTDVTVAGRRRRGWQQVGAGAALPGHRRRRRPGPVRGQLRGVHLRQSRPATVGRHPAVRRARGLSRRSRTRCSATTATARSRDISRDGRHRRGTPAPAWAWSARDYDNDGDTDIFVLNDVSRNFLFQNDGTGKFEEVGLAGRRGLRSAPATRWAAWASTAPTTTTTAGSISS